MRPVMLGGPDLTVQGARAVPSLTYLERQPEFSIGPDDPTNENPNIAQQAETRQNGGARAEDRSTDGAKRKYRSAGRHVLGRPR